MVDTGIQDARVDMKLWLNVPSFILFHLINTVLWLAAQYLHTLSLAAHSSSHLNVL